MAAFLTVIFKEIWMQQPTTQLSIVIVGELILKVKFKIVWHDLGKTSLLLLLLLLL